MRGQLLNHKRETQFEDHLQRDQAKQSVVVTLLDGAEEAHNQQHSPGATRDVHHPRQESVGNRTI